jgi:DNA-binding LacI/PurR family transcriptional regulator
LDAGSAAEAVTGWTAHSVTGVCAFNDEVAMAVLAGIRAHGLTAPGDIAVIGADDIPVGRLAVPPLSTVAFDLHEAGRYRAEEILAGLEQREAPAATPAVGPRLIHRESS